MDKKIKELIEWVNNERSLTWMMSENEHLDQEDRDQWTARWVCYVDMVRKINEIFGTDFDPYGVDENE